MRLGRCSMPANEHPAAQVRYVGVNEDRAACESSPYPSFARDDYDRGHEFRCMADGRYHCRFCGVHELYWRGTRAVAA